jgi:predicted transcriptional regulator
MADTENSLRDLVAGVAASYFENNHVSPQEIPSVVAQIAASLAAVGEVVPEPTPAEERPAKATAAQVRKSITPDALMSFEDGKSYKTLKRHLTLKGLSPSDYRTKWGLPNDYPMTAPAYSARRSELARSLGLGRASAKKPRKAKA